MLVSELKLVEIGMEDDGFPPLLPLPLKMYRYLRLHILSSLILKIIIISVASKNPADPLILVSTCCLVFFCFLFYFIQTCCLVGIDNKYRLDEPDSSLSWMPASGQAFCLLPSPRMISSCACVRESIEICVH